MIYVMSGGTGGGDAFAVISVTYPAGSTCTCSNGSKTLRAKDTSGSYLFMIPEAGTWTVTATDGTYTASQSVSITTQYQAATATLTYELLIFADGVLHYPFTAVNNSDTKASIKGVSGNEFTIYISTWKNNTWCAARTQSMIDMTPYTRLCCTAKRLNGAGSGMPWGAMTGAQTLAASTPLTGTGYKDYSVDISAISSAYVGFYMSTYGSGANYYGDYVFSRIWLGN